MNERKLEATRDLLRVHFKGERECFEHATDPTKPRIERIRLLREMGMNFADAKSLTDRIGRKYNF